MPYSPGRWDERQIPTSSQQSNLRVFGRTLLPAVVRLLFCRYVLFIQYTCSIYFLFSCVFFLASNRSQHKETLPSKTMAIESFKLHLFLIHIASLYSETSLSLSLPLSLFLSQSVCLSFSLSLSIYIYIWCFSKTHIIS